MYIANVCVVTLLSQICKLVLDIIYYLLPFFFKYSNKIVTVHAVNFHFALLLFCFFLAK